MVIKLLFIVTFSFSCFADTVYYLHESTQIIRNLINSNQLATIFEDTNQEQLNVLINNYSPAIIALEAEVLDCTLPVMLYFYKQEDRNHQSIITILNNYALTYDNRIKFVAVDIEQLPNIAVQFNIATTPAISTMIKRHEIKFTDTEISETQLYTCAEKLLQSCKKLQQS